MAAKDYLWLLDYYSQFLGISIFVHERSKFLIYLNYCWKCTQMILSLLGAAYSFKTIFHSVAPLYDLDNVMFFVGNFIINLVMYIQVDNIRKEFNNLFTKMKEHQRRKMYIVSCCLTSISILIQVWFIVINALLQSDTSYSWDDYLIFVILQVNGDLYFPSLTWVTLMILGSYFVSQNYLKDIDKRLTRRTDRDAPLPDFVLSRAIIIKQSVSAVNMFSGIPLFVTIGYVFIGFSGVLSLLRNNTEADLVWKISEFIYVVIFFFAITALLVMVTVFRHKLESRRSALIFKLSLQNHESLTVNWKIGHETLCDSKFFKFTVMGLFPLNFNLILKFAASHVTFTILMLQLESSV